MSGYVPGFDNDLFVSYAHGDDPGWVSALEKGLGEELSSRLGVQVTVWQDAKRLRAGQNWQSEIETGVKGSAVFVALLSPSYNNSGWCKRERDLFRQLFDTREAFENGNRFFKVVKTPWDDNRHRQFLAAIQDLDFFRPDDGPSGHLEFVPGSAEFRSAVSRLGNAIAHTLRGLRLQRERVFVASPAADCEDVWNQLRDELHDRGYDVRPSGYLSDDYEEELIRREIEGALLSVHLLGAVYDPFAERQIGLAAELDRRLTFWLTAQAGGTADANQARLLAQLGDGKRPDRPTTALPAGWTLLRDRAAYRLIEEALASLKPKPADVAVPAGNGGASRVYIVHDATTEEDALIASTLREQIVEREHLPVFLSRADLPSAADLKMRHEQLMQTCEGVLLCRSAAPSEWLMQVAPEVIFAEKLLRRPPLKSRAFLVPDPAQWAGYPNLQAIPYHPELQLRELEPFLAPLRAGAVAHGA